MPSVVLAPSGLRNTRPDLAHRSRDTGPSNPLGRPRVIPFGEVPIASALGLSPKIPEKCPSRALRGVQRRDHRECCRDQSQKSWRGTHSERSWCHNRRRAHRVPLRGSVPKPRITAWVPDVGPGLHKQAPPGHQPFTSDPSSSRPPRFLDLDTHTRNWPLWTTGRGRCPGPAGSPGPEALCLKPWA